MAPKLAKEEVPDIESTRSQVRVRVFATTTADPSPSYCSSSLS